jgi:hypothetical protein
MWWATWQQHRFELIIGGIVLAAASLFLLVTGLHMASDYRQLGVGGCLGTVGAAQSAACGDILYTFQERYLTLANAVTFLLVLAPAVMGILVAAPLVARELEQGTYLLAWTQGVTRQRWLTVKLAAILATSLGAAALLALLLTWWRGPLDHLQSRLTPMIFDVEGLVPIAYMAFAVALGVAAGAFFRRTLAAMAATIGALLLLRLPLTLGLRYAVLAPKTVTWDLLTQADPTIAVQQGGLVLDRGWMSHQGHIVPDATVNGTCSSLHDFVQCVHAHGWLRYNVYQPDARFWTLQGLESALFLALALVLIASTVWWIRSHVR